MNIIVTSKSHMLLWANQSSNWAVKNSFCGEGGDIILISQINSKIHAHAYCEENLKIKWLSEKVKERLKFTEKYHAFKITLHARRGSVFEI